MRLVYITLARKILCYGSFPAKVLLGTNAYNSLRFYPPTLDIYDKMAGADAVGLFSLYEGLSNTVCEAMCLGKPVLATDVLDNRLLLKDDRLISDASSPRSIAGTVSYLMSLPEEELKAIGRRNRNRAEELFSEDRIIGQYLSCFDR